MRLRRPAPHVLALLATAAVILALFPQCAPLGGGGSAAGVGACGSNAGTATLTTSAGATTVMELSSAMGSPQCSFGDGPGHRPVLFFFCGTVGGMVGASSVCVAVGLDTPASGAGDGSYATGVWGWPDPYSGGNNDFTNAQGLPAAAAYVWAGLFTYQAKTFFPGAAGGTVAMSGSMLPTMVNQSGQAHLQATGVPLANGATLSFSVDLGVSIEAAMAGGSSGGGSGGFGSGSGAGSGGGSGGGGSCPCMASAAPSYTACSGGDQAACYCAAAYLDSCGIQNAAQGCCTTAAGQATCIAQLKSDCEMQIANAVALASSGVTPECQTSTYPSCQ